MLKSPPTVTSGSRDSRFIASSFITDLHSRMPTLCGEPARYSSKALTPLALLQTAATPTNYPNIRAVPGPSRPASAAATPTSLGARKGTTGLIGRASAALASSGHVTSSYGSHSCHVTPSNGNHSGHVTSFNGSHSGRVTPSQNIPQRVPGTCSSAGSHSQSDPRRKGDPNHPPLNQGTNLRIVPVFRPTQTSRLPPLTTPQQVARKSAPIVPSFKPLSRPQTVPTSPVAPSRPGQGSRKTSTATSQQSSGPSGKKRCSTASSLPIPQQPQKQCRVNAVSVSASLTAGGGGVQENSVGGERCNPVQQRSLATSARGSEQTVPDLSLMVQTETDCLSTSLDNQYTSVHIATPRKKVGSRVCTILKHLPLKQYKDTYTVSSLRNWAMIDFTM